LHVNAYTYSLLIVIVIHYDTGCHYDSYSNYYHYAVIVILGSSPQAKVDFSVRLLAFHFARGLDFLFLFSF